MNGKRINLPKVMKGRMTEIRAVQQLGEIIGYGNMINIACALWTKLMQEEHGIENSYPCLPSIEHYMTEEGKTIVIAEIQAKMQEIDTVKEMYDARLRRECSKCDRCLCATCKNRVICPFCNKDSYEEFQVCEPYKMECMNKNNDWGYEREDKT